MPRTFFNNKKQEQIQSTLVKKRICLLLVYKNTIVAMNLIAKYGPKAILSLADFFFVINNRTATNPANKNEYARNFNNKVVPKTTPIENDIFTFKFTCITLSYLALTGRYKTPTSNFVENNKYRWEINCP